MKVVLTTFFVEINMFINYNISLWGGMLIIDKSAHYFILMHPLEVFMVPTFGAVVFTSSNTREKWVECIIDESDGYKIEDGYNVVLRSVEPGYGKKSYDQLTFVSLLREGHIVKKEPDMECVEEKWSEPLTNNVSLHHSAYVLKKVSKK